MASATLGNPAPQQTRLDYASIEQLWINNGGSVALAPVMAAIALAESGGNTQALNNNPQTGDYSVGLWQINYYGNLLPGRTERYGSPAALSSDPNAQARAAIDLAGNGSGLGNWTTYTSGAYRQYLQGSGLISTGSTGTITTPQATLTGKLFGLTVPSINIPGLGNIDLVPGLGPIGVPNVPKGLEKALPSPSNLKLAAIDAAKIAMGGLLIYVGVKGLMGQTSELIQRQQEALNPRAPASSRVALPASRGGRRRDARQPRGGDAERTRATQRTVRANPAPPFRDEPERASGGARYEEARRRAREQVKPGTRLG